MFTATYVRYGRRCSQAGSWRAPGPAGTTRGRAARHRRTPVRRPLTARTQLQSTQLELRTCAATSHVGWLVAWVLLAPVLAGWCGGSRE